MTNGEIAMIVAQLVDTKNIKSGFVRNLAIVDVMKQKFDMDAMSINGADVFAQSEKILDEWYK